MEEATTAQPTKKTIRIVHTRAEGTLIKGSRKGDGVWDIVKRRGFRSSRYVGLYIPNSRDRAAKRWIIEDVAAALRAAGFTVAIDIDDIMPGRSFAEAEADRNERAEERAYRYGEWAERNTAAGNTRWERTRERMRHLPPGQPVLEGHHSERGHRRLLDWAHAQDGKAVEELNKGAYWAGRSAAAERYQRHREDPGVTRRRIERLEADRRRIERELQDKPTRLIWAGQELPEGAEVEHTYDDGSRRCRLPLGEQTIARYQADIAAIDDELGYWRDVLAEAEQRGVKLWSKADFAKGDFVIYHGDVVEVMRVNAKSVTIPWAHYWVGTPGGPVRTVAQCKEIANPRGRERLFTDTVPYDKIQGKVSAAELDGLDPAQVRELIARKVRQARGQRDTP
ncbi:hypothetical protein GCM10010156_49450 [Planobispora rosea]|uniref:DUF3560 domain-containing protein n=1 Tax=Planobispora rosea TaxID=35762 RepID=A0A8J3S0T4_PLARO|nr:DUF3560 domain-containing protein [Planobispora rosea]GGS84941.1 hypothetical protein GCM10010156_49450 [Planobispora rosea]GIH86456.1 hypothetical protein Pro02_48640 [Planobispora rosea]